MLARSGPIREPVKPTCSASQKPAEANKHSNVPIGCARNDARASPFAAYEKAVVMPQVGHGLPNVWTQVHSMRPSWVWVPWPASAGRRKAAVARTANNAKAITNAANRGPIPTVRGDTPPRPDRPNDDLTNVGITLKEGYTLRPRPEFRRVDRAIGAVG